MPEDADELFVKYELDKDLPFGDIGCVVCKRCAALVPDQNVARQRHSDFHTWSAFGIT